MTRFGSTFVIAVVGIAGVAALTGAALVLVRALDSSAKEDVGVRQAEPPAAISARVLCSLSNDDALASLVTGADGGASVVVGGRTWWLFGDTLFRGDSGKQIEANSIASSVDVRPDGCPRLVYHEEDGIAVPFIPKDGSLTVWPTGGWPASDTQFYFYTAYVYGSGPYSYTVDDIGVGLFDTSTMKATVLARRLWDETSGFTSRVLHVQPVETDDDGALRLVLHTQTTDKLLARVNPARIADPTAYEYWDGSSWTRSPADAAVLWRSPDVATDIDELGAFENGASIAWNEALGKYVAVVNVGYDGVGARVADDLEGPWSEPVRWLDCLAFARPRVPACYSPQQHPSYAEAGGRTLYATISAIEPYETQFVEIMLGDAVHEYTLDGRVRYSIQPLAGWQDQGVAFYAAAKEVPGFSVVYGWERGEEVRYAPSSPGEGFERKEPAFAAPLSADSANGLIHYQPVYEWTDGEAHILSPLQSGLEEFGYTRGGAMFYAP